MWLKQSTAVTIRIGPFLDRTDGVTEETGLSLAATDVQISKNWGAFANKNSATAPTHDSDGWYTVALNTTDTATLGPLVVKVQDNTTHLPVRESFTVVPANTYDSLIGNSDALSVDVTRISGDTSAANNLESQYDGTGLVGDNYPATQSQVGDIAIAGAAINDICESYTLTTGTQSSGTFTDTQTLDGTYHEHTDSAGAMELYYQFDIGNSGIPTSVKFVGRLNGQNDTLSVFAYDWVGAAWEQIGTLSGTNGGNDSTETYDLLIGHVGTGSNAGKVRIRFYAASGLTTATLRVDQLIVSYAQALTGIANGSTITLNASTVNTNLIGRGWFLDLNGQEISGSYIYQSISVTGVGTATNGSPYIIQECQLGNVTLDCYGYLEKVALGGTFTGASTSGVSNDVLTFKGCFSSVAGSGAPSIDFSGVTKTTSLNVREWNGGGTWTFTADCTVSIEVNRGGTHTITTGGGDVEFRGTPKALVVTTSGSSTTNIVLWSGAPITINGTGGTVTVKGLHCGITDNSTGTTITDSGKNVSTLSDHTLADLFTYTVEGSETFEEQLRLMRAEAAGKLAVSGTTVTIRDAADSKDRITATVDANGQRTSVTTDGS